MSDKAKSFTGKLDDFFAEEFPVFETAEDSGEVLGDVGGVGAGFVYEGKMEILIDGLDCVFDTGGGVRIFLFN